jgi:hypothetical protein
VFLALFALSFSSGQGIYFSIFWRLKISIFVHEDDKPLEWCMADG